MQSDEEKTLKNVFNLGKRRTEKAVTIAFSRDDVSIKDLAAYSYLQGVQDGWEAAEKHFVGEASKNENSKQNEK